MSFLDSNKIFYYIRNDEFSCDNCSAVLHYQFLCTFGQYKQSRCYFAADYFCFYFKNLIILIFCKKHFFIYLIYVFEFFFIKISILKWRNMMNRLNRQSPKFNDIEERKKKSVTYIGLRQCQKHTVQCIVDTLTTVSSNNNNWTKLLYVK